MIALEMDSASNFPCKLSLPLRSQISGKLIQILDAIAARSGLPANLRGLLPECALTDLEVFGSFLRCEMRSRWRNWT